MRKFLNGTFINVYNPLQWSVNRHSHHCLESSTSTFTKCFFFSPSLCLSPTQWHYFQMYEGVDTGGKSLTARCRVLILDLEMSCLKLFTEKEFIRLKTWALLLINRSDTIFSCSSFSC